MRTTSATVLLAVLAIFTPRQSWACSCVPPGTPQAELQESDAVFVGKVIDVRAGEPRQAGVISSLDPVLVRFEVLGYWKGSIRNTAVVTTPASGSSCGFGFQRGREYVVYANKDKAGSYVTSICGRTKSLQGAIEDLKELGAPKKPAA